MVALWRRTFSQGLKFVPLSEPPQLSAFTSSFFCNISALVAAVIYGVFLAVIYGAFFFSGNFRIGPIVTFVFGDRRFVQC